MIGRTNVGGGAGLNFKVIGNPQPETAKDNTIWVNTDEEITSWIFAATQPETAEEGMVWISTGTSSTVKFNALKKNGITVYPLSAKQYISGAWVEVPAKSYQDGEWVDWVPEGALYYNGSECESFTGGWVGRAVGQSTGGWTVCKPTIQNNGQNLVIGFDSAYASTHVNGVAEIDNAIDLTKYNTIEISFDEVVLTGGTAKTMAYAAVYSSGDNPYSSTAARATYDAGTSHITIDVSGLEGVYTVGFLVAQNASTKTTLKVREAMAK